MAFAGRLVTAEIAMFEAVKERSDHAPVWIELAERKAGHRGAGATPKWRNGPPEQPRSAARQASSASGSKAEVKKREITGQFEGVVISRTARAIPVR